MKQGLNVMSVHSTCAVRPAQPCDCDAMADLARQLGYECTGEEARKRLSDMHDANHYTVFVAELVGGKIAGWIGAHVFRSVETATCAEISGLVVDEGLRSLRNREDVDRRCQTMGASRPLPRYLRAVER